MRQGCPSAPLYLASSQQTVCYLLLISLPQQKPHLLCSEYGSSFRACEQDPSAAAMLRIVIVRLATVAALSPSVPLSLSYALAAA